MSRSAPSQPRASSVRTRPLDATSARRSRPARGARLAVDDAGAGFASLRHVLKLSPDFIKLDTSLITGIDHDRGRRALAAGLIAFAGELHAEIIAEGIETLGELQALRALGVRYGQGFYLAVPGPLPPASGRIRGSVKP